MENNENQNNKYQYMTDEELSETKEKLRTELDLMRERLTNELYEVQREIDLRRNQKVKEAYDKYIETYNAYQQALQPSITTGIYKMPVYKSMFY